MPVKYLTLTVANIDRIKKNVNFYKLNKLYIKMLKKVEMSRKEIFLIL